VADRVKHPEARNRTLEARQVKAKAAELGFAACGVATLDPIPHGDHLDRWLKSGYGGNMRYLNRQARKRKNPQLADINATRAVVVLDNYYYSESTSNPSIGRQVKLARYARGQDYHRTTFERVQALAEFLTEGGAATARPYVDTGPVQERELAQRAGLGWIGKNTMLIRPGAGSFCFIGTVFTDLELAPDAPLAADHCGTCTACLDACPTAALVAPRLLDATRCISYLTIESGQPIPEALAPKLSGWAFGCDICNDVCPWNERFAAATTRPEYQPRPEPDTSDPDCFSNMTEEDFTARFGDTPLARPGLGRMRQNWKTAFATRPTSGP